MIDTWIYHINVVGDTMFHLYHCIIQVEIDHIQFYSLVMYLL